MFRKIVNRLSLDDPQHAIRLIAAALFLRPSQEQIYRDLFVRDLAEFGIADEYYPLRGAANYSLLYLLTRIFKEFEVESVLEFGIGQTTVLIDKLAKASGRTVRLESVEHEEEWKNVIASRVSHQITVAPLTGTGTTYGRQFYDSKVIPTGLFQLMVVDGPPADVQGNRFARNGFADIFAERLAENFVIIVDDAERKGERSLIRLVRKALKEAGRTYAEGEALALKRQKVFCGGDYARAAHF